MGETVNGLHETLQGFISKVHRIVSWQDVRISFIISISCLILSIAMIWIQRPVFVIVACFIFLQGTPTWSYIQNWRAGYRAYKKMLTQKKPEKWPFFKPAGAVTDGEGAESEAASVLKLMT